MISIINILQISSQPMETKPRNINLRTQSWLEWDKSSFELQFINYKMLWTIFTTGSWHQGLNVKTKYTKLNCSTKLWQREAAPAYCNMYVKIALVILSITSSYITSLICQNVLRPHTPGYWALMFYSKELPTRISHISTRISVFSCKYITITEALLVERYI